ncbi:MAG TPA: response regulator, partial [Isosphaeraceae bacterium]|nr:response regulator [Isosphaeraceae bacterium]
MPRSSAPRVLIIEDDRASYLALRSILLRRGCQVELANGVSEGIGKLDAELDWIVLDLMLPDGDGEDVLKEL